MPIVKNYKANSTAQKFHASDKFIRGFMGPVGNGKSVACILDIWKLANEQAPNSQGIRKTRFLIVRNTSHELRTTTLKTWQEWFPESISPVVTHPLITTRIQQPVKGTPYSIDMEVIFLAMDRDDDVKKVLSLDISGAFINEARELPYAIIDAVRDRCGRYPGEAAGYQDVLSPEGTYIYKCPRAYHEDGSVKLHKDGTEVLQPCTRKALVLDTNPPPTDHWWYQLAEDGYLKDTDPKQIAHEKKAVSRIFEFFRGPAPLIKQADGSYIESANAENLHHLPGGIQYYLDLIAGKGQDYIDVQVLGNYGEIMQGRPIYPEYNDRVHCEQGRLGPIEDLPICLGWDFGLTPACIIGQIDSRGQARIIAELTTLDMDVKKFARDVVKPFLQAHLSKYEIGFSLGDPAGNNRGEGEGKSAIGILNDQYLGNYDEPLDMGFSTEPAPTNDPTLRWNAVRSFLRKMVGKGEPGLVISKNCAILRKGFLGGYCFKRIAQSGKTDLYHDKADKNKYSHPHDAAQYLCLGFQGGHVQEHQPTFYESPPPTEW